MTHKNYTISENDKWKLHTSEERYINTTQWHTENIQQWRITHRNYTVSRNDTSELNNIKKRHIDTTHY